MEEIKDLTQVGELSGHGESNGYYYYYYYWPPTLQGGSSCRMTVKALTDHKKFLESYLFAAVVPFHFQLSVCTMHATLINNSYQ